MEWIKYSLYIRPIRFANSIQNRIGRPIRFEIRFERKKTIRMSLYITPQISIYIRHMTLAHFDETMIRLMQFSSLISRSNVTFYNAPQFSHCKRCTSYGNSVRLSVCLSVRPSVTRRYCVKTTARRTVQFALSDSKMFLVL